MRSLLAGSTAHVGVGFVVAFGLIVVFGVWALHNLRHAEARDEPARLVDRDGRRLRRVRRLGVRAQERLAAMLGSDVATARSMAVRDLGSGVILLAARDPRPALDRARPLRPERRGDLRPRPAEGRRGRSGFAALGIAACAALMELLTGAEARVTNPGGRKAVVCVNGGTGKEVAGTWAPTLELLVHRLAPQFPELSFVEVRYRIKSWKRLTWCIDDCRAAITLAAGEGAEEIALLGFSMGGAVSIAAADHPLVSTVIGLAPWIPDRLDVARARRPPASRSSTARSTAGCRASPASARRARCTATSGSASAGSTPRTRSSRARCTGIAVPPARRRLVPLPRADRWVELSAELARSRGRSTAHPPDRVRNAGRRPARVATDR